MVQAWRVGDERVETCLRLLVEAALRQAGDRLRGLDAAAGTDVWSDPGMAPFAAAEGAAWKAIRAGRILVGAGVLDREFLGRFAGDLNGGHQGPVTAPAVDSKTTRPVVEYIPLSANLTGLN
jgi:hypothetical protein